MTDLADLIAVVRKKLADHGNYDARDYEGWKRWHAGGARILQELRDECGARIRTDKEPATMAMGGVKTTATTGWIGLLNNWIAAAQRRIDQS